MYALAYALRGIKAKRRAGSLSEEDRYAPARVVVDKLRERGDAWGLDGAVPTSFMDRRPPAIGDWKLR